MIERDKATDTADIIEQHDDPEYFALGTGCLEIDETHYCQAGRFTVGTRHTGATDTISIMLGKGSGGLHWQYTIHGARQLAQRLLAMAGKIETRQADQARTMLAATLGKDATSGI